MKLLGFFACLFNLITGNVSRVPTARRHRAAGIRRLQRKKELQRLAQDVGNQKRVRAWQTAVLQGYAEKERLAAAGKGRNSTAGIPDRFRNLKPAAPTA